MLRGTVVLPALVLADPATPVAGVLADATTSFSAMASASDAAKAFECYDLVSAPVIDHRCKLVIRALALDTIQATGARRMMYKELALGLLNGVVWGLVIGVFAVALCANIALGLVMALAVVLNLVVAAAGVTIPLALHGAGRDPAHGSSVLLTFITDAMGFLLCLGLAAAFLLP